MTNKQIIIFVSILGAIIILLGVGIGFVLSKLISGLEIGMGIIAGAIFSVGIIDFTIRFIVGLNKTMNTLMDIIIRKHEQESKL